LFSPSLVYILSAIALVAGVVLVVFMLKASISSAWMTILSVLAGFCFGIVTNVGTAILLLPVDTGSVSLDTIRDQVISGQPIGLSGRAEVPAGSSLWIIAYRPSGGFEVESRQPVPVDPEGRWSFQPLTIGHANRDADQIYTVAAVILNEEGAASITSEIASSPDPADIFIGQPSPDGLQVQSTQQVKLAAFDSSPPMSTSSPAPTACPPAGQPEATLANVVRLHPPGFPLSVESAYYRVKLAGKVQLELGGQIAGNIPAGKQLFLLGWADPATADSTPMRSRGDGVYYQVSAFQVAGNCFLRPQGQIAYDGANGLTFRYLFVLVDDGNVSSFTNEDRNKNGFDDAALNSMNVTRIAYFDVPTKDL
jgi:hypothetical protein